MAGRGAFLIVRILMVIRRRMMIIVVIVMMIRVVIIVMITMVRMVRVRRAAMVAVAVVAVRPMTVVVAAYDVVLHAAHIFHGIARGNGAHDFLVGIRTIVFINAGVGARDGITTAGRDDAGGEGDQWGKEECHHR